MNKIDHIQGHTYHGRKGDIENAFRYSIDYVMCDPEQGFKSPRFFSRNAFNLAGLYDIDHGGAPGAGQGTQWVRDVLNAHDLPKPDNIQLLTQPRFWDHVFNPVSFWLCFDGEGGLLSVISEVTNTFGERHSYLCHRDDGKPIQATDDLHASKIFYVSPFQKIEGSYTFRFDIRDDRIGVWIDYSGKKDGLIATLVGRRNAMTNGSLVWAALRRPLGSRRVLALIHWQALKLWWKGAVYRVRPKPPTEEVSR